MTLRRDTLWNVVGMAGPLVAAAVCIPFVLNRLGGEAFGVVTLIWALIGYFGLFDMGMGRALTFEISKLSADGRESSVSQTLSAGLFITLAAGIIGGLALLLLAPQLAGSWLKIGISWQPDAQLAFQIAAMGVIPTTLTSGLRGALEGFGRFAASNLMRLFFGLCMFVLPALSIILHGNSIAYIAGYLVGARLVVVLVGFFQLRAHLIFAVSWAEVARVRSLLSYGFWVTVSGIVGPLMIYGDRFFVSAMVGADQLPFYAIPQEGLQRLLIIPGALCAALLPRFTSMHGKALVSFLNISYKRLALGMFFVCLLAALLAGPILSWWLSPDFAERATPIVWVLAIGIWFNSLAQLPYTVIHSLGQPKLTAIFHLVELVFYFFSLYFLAQYFGLLGAAVAWVARVVLDLGLLFLASNRLLGKDRNNARN